MPSNSPKPMKAQKDSTEEDYTMTPAQDDFIQAQIEDAPARISLKTFLALMVGDQKAHLLLTTLGLIVGIRQWLPNTTHTSSHC